MPAHPLLPLIFRTLGHPAVVLTGLGVFTAIDFSHTITLGSILIAFIVLAIAGVFTVRSKIATVWRLEAEGERAARERLQEQLEEAKESRAAFEREQQELRHDLKGEIASCKAQLKAMEARTDLSAALDAIQKMSQEAVNEISGAIAETFVERSAQEHARTHELLIEIRDKLPAEPIAVPLPEKPIPVHEIDPTE